MNMISPLEMLPGDEADWLRPLLGREHLSAGAVLAEDDAEAGALWLAGDAVTARVAVHPLGATREIGLDGVGTIVCAFALLGAGRVPWQVVVSRAGSAWRLDRARFAEVRFRAPGLQRLAETKASADVAALCRGFAAASRCSAVATVAARLVDHFLTLEAVRIRMTHRSLAGLLELRRETVTLSLQELEGARAIRNRRGEIELVDLARLEGFARLA